MPFDESFRLGPFTVAADGHIVPTAPEQPARFHLAWNSIRVDAALAADAAGSLLDLRATAGRVPSSARPPAPAGAGRPEVFATLRELRRRMAPDWALALLPDHRVAVQQRVALAPPVRATDLVAALTLFLLAARPYLVLLGEAGLEPPGTVNTCPG